MKYLSSLLCLALIANAHAGSSCGNTVLNQNISTVPQPGASLACSPGEPNFFTHAASYYRAFSLASFPAGFTVCSVDVGIESANAAGTGTTQALTVRIYASNGAAFPGGTRTIVGSTNLNLADTALSVLTVPITADVPAGTSQLVAEVFSPEGVAAGNQFYLGANSSGASGPSFIASPVCGATPTNVANIGFPNTHFIMTVAGTAGSGELILRNGFE
jgi:hypothetical protein